MHFSWTMLAFPCRFHSMAPTGHFAAHRPQRLQRSTSISNDERRTRAAHSTLRARSNPVRHSSRRRAAWSCHRRDSASTPASTSRSRSNSTRRRSRKAVGSRSSSRTSGSASARSSFSSSSAWHACAFQSRTW